MKHHKKIYDKTPFTWREMSRWITSHSQFLESSKTLNYAMRQLTETAHVMNDDIYEQTQRWYAWCEAAIEEFKRTHYPEIVNSIFHNGFEFAPISM